RDADDVIGFGISVLDGFVFADPRSAARALRVERIAVLERDDLGIPTLRQLAELHLHDLGVFDARRIADLGYPVVIAPPAILPTEMPAVGAAAQPDHGEVPGPSGIVRETQPL